jgi:hypothetical protein
MRGDDEGMVANEGAIGTTECSQSQHEPSDDRSRRTRDLLPSDGVRWN